MDWLEDMLYWTNGDATEIRRVNLMSTDSPVTTPHLIEVDIEEPKFTDIVLDPIIR